ncbi:MAG: hypothetical protein EOP83_01930 [Verrucomicrobiaceae bacterium]|nr:MAG: hypothetical protein EOP83_01930 [Verrucomicrobiaceae bacterium]
MNAYGKGALIGAATLYVVPSFLGTVGRFLLFNCIEILVLIVLSNTYGALTNQAGKDKLVQAATPKDSQLRTSNMQMAIGPSGRTLYLTFTNDSARTLNNLMFHCDYEERVTNAFEDVSVEPRAVRTRWVLGRFAPKTSYQLSVPVVGYPNATPTRCKVFYDDFSVEMTR